MHRWDPVAITGIGIVSSLGHTPGEFTAGLDEGRVAVAPAPWSRPDEGRPAWWCALPDWYPSTWLDDRVVDGTDLFAQYALVAAIKAVEDFGEPLDEGTGVVVGNTQAGVTSLTEAQHLLDVSGPSAVPRKLNIKAWPNMAGGQIAMHWKLHGPLLTVSSACASSIDAIGTALGWIEQGRADVVLAGGTERGLVDLLFHAQVAYGMAKSVDDPALATIPFDVRRSGLVEGDGAAMLVLERASRARARGARIHGYISGYASLSDGYHPSSPDPSGRWEAEVMRQAHASAGLTAADVNGIIAHATSTPKGDLAEIEAINAVFGERGQTLHVTSIKGNVGHTGAASGAMGVIAALHAINDGTLSPIGGCEQPEPGAQFEIVTGKPSPDDYAAMQVNAFGFGGQNTSLVVTRDATP